MSGSESSANCDFSAKSRVASSDKVVGSAGNSGAIGSTGRFRNFGWCSLDDIDESIEKRVAIDVCSLSVVLGIKKEKFLNVLSFKNERIPSIEEGASHSF
jgi:hypothetical protein